jgi:hypothetical protein
LQAERAAEFGRKHKEPTLRAWMAAGGTEADFQRVWESELRDTTRAEVAKVEAERRRRVSMYHARCAF